MLFHIGMRFWIFFLAFLVVSLAIVQTYRLTPLANEYLPQEFSRRTINFEGNHLVSEEQLLARIPIATNLSWYLMPNQIEQALEREPLIEKAEVTSCTQWSVDCYQVKIVEYRPDYLYKVANNNWWLVTRGGDFLLPINQLKAEEYFSQLPRLEDLLFSGKNIEFLGTRLRYLVALNDQLVSQGIQPVSLQLQTSNELKLLLKDNTGEIFFSNADLSPDKFNADIQNLKSFFHSQKVPEASAWSLDLRPKHPVLKVVATPVAVKS